MIVCSCRAVSETTIRAAIAEGADTVDAVGEACSAGTDCGSCRSQIQGLLGIGREPCSAVGEARQCGRAGRRLPAP